VIVTGGRTSQVNLVLKKRIKYSWLSTKDGINPEYGGGTWKEVTITHPQRMTTATLINRGEPQKGDSAVLPAGQRLKRRSPERLYWMELPGAYQVKAAYHNSNNGKRFGLSAWIGEITSNSISLTVSG
jgi:hypothetical protein